MVRRFSVGVNGQECDRGETNPSGEPRQNLLREHPVCREILDALHAMGVHEFRFAMRYLDGDSVDHFFGYTWLAKGVWLTGRREGPARLLQYRLASVVEGVIEESLVGTDAEDSDLFVVVYGGFESESQQWSLRASVTAVMTDPYFRDLTIELI
jgi:hypothetical protein